MKQTKLLTDAAILLAIFVILLAMTMYVPFIGFITLFFLATPFIIMLYRHDVKATWFMFTGALLISLIVGQALAIPFALTYGLVGIAMGYFYKKQQPHMALVFGTLSFLGSLLFTYALSILLFDMNWIAQISEEMRRSFQETANMFEALGQEVPKETIDQMEELFQLMGMLLPTALVLSSLFFATITHVVNRLVLRRLKLEVSPLLPFRDWSLPKSIIWYYLIVIFMQFMDLEKGSFLFIAIFNMVGLLQILLLIQGLSFLFYYSHVKKKPKWLPITGVLIVIILYPLQELIRILGIIDLGFDLRSKLKGNDV